MDRAKMYHLGTKKTWFDQIFTVLNFVDFKMLYRKYAITKSHDRKRIDKIHFTFAT
jgi:hypothetical protein